MKTIVLTLLGGLALISGGCNRESASSNAQLKQQAILLANKIRTEMTKPSIMKLPVGPTPDTGDRARQQQAIAQPLMNQLMTYGAAAETPLRELINDEDLSVRRTTIWMTCIRAPWKGDNGREINEQTILELNIPILERALESDDPQLRIFACTGLGDYADAFPGCVMRIADALPAIAKLKNDVDKDVHSAAEVVHKHILWRVSVATESDEGQNADQAELKKPGQQKDEG